MHGWWGRGLEHMESEQGWWLDGDAGATTVSKSMQNVGRAATAVGGRRILWHDNAIHGEWWGGEGNTIFDGDLWRVVSRFETS
jgi:hypothetical protein